MKTVILLVIGILMLSSCGPNPKDFESGKDPKIVQLAKQKMLILEVTGNPEGMGKEVGKLYTTFYKMNFKGKKTVAPRARWLNPINTPLNDWKAIWALPVSGDAELPKGLDASLKLDSWYGGQVAEIVHFGSYESETTNIDKLHQFISNSGYRISGPHEEEYIKGPGFFGKGNPNKYITIIRYEVEPVATNKVK